MAVSAVVEAQASNLQTLHACGMTTGETPLLSGILANQF